MNKEKDLIASSRNMLNIKIPWTGFFYRPLCSSYRSIHQHVFFLNGKRLQLFFKVKTTLFLKNGRCLLNASNFICVGHKNESVFFDWTF